MTLQHAKAIKIVLSLRCQEEIKYEKMNVHAVMLREINFGVTNVQVGNIWLHMFCYMQSPYNVNISLN